MKSMKRNANLMIKIDEKIKDKLQRYCENNDIPMSIIVRQLIKDFLIEEKDLLNEQKDLLDAINKQE